MAHSVEVSIGHKTYRLAVEQGQEQRIKGLAARVDAIVNELRHAAPDMDRDSVLVLTAMQLVADLAATQDELDTQGTAVGRFHRILAERLETLAA